MFLHSGQLLLLLVLNHLYCNQRETILMARHRADVAHNYFVNHCDLHMQSTRMHGTREILGYIKST